MIKIYGKTKIFGKSLISYNKPIIPIIPIISILLDNQTIDIVNTYNYLVVDNSIVSNFKLTFDGVDGVTFTDSFDINDYYNCKLTISTTPNISSNKDEVYVTTSASFSTIQDKLFTFYYFNTGSLILGVSPINSPLPSPPQNIVDVIANSYDDINKIISIESSMITPFVYDNNLISNRDSFMLWSAVDNYFFEL
jgi:hypothetical protein